MVDGVGHGLLPLCRNDWQSHPIGQAQRCGGEPGAQRSIRAQTPDCARQRIDITGGYDEPGFAIAD
jgi:hypothetical protein